jgi:hypothetical protein
MPEQPLNSPALLTKNHELAGFDCGKPPLNDFLLKYALQNQASGGARTYVTAPPPINRRGFPGSAPEHDSPHASLLRSDLQDFTWTGFTL